MKISDILQVESDNKNCIHIIRDRLFWTVYEMSAYYFVNNFKSYKVHSKFVQNVKRDYIFGLYPSVVFLFMAHISSLVTFDGT